ncbi:MAG: SusC/RagA family TonB-linked outer membrane protein [Gemmatimonadales bacterium]|nr:MAG: SusC/RagA family TonB-linked outer membrane protein [Gemmatimonadales bacterium]
MQFPFREVEVHMHKMLRLAAAGIISFLLAPAAPAVAAQAPPSSIALASPASAEVEAGILDRPANLDIEAVPLHEALALFERAAGVSVAFSPTLLPSDHLASCACHDLTVREAMRTILEGTSLEAFVLSHYLVIRERKRAAPPVPMLQRALVAFASLESGDPGVSSEFSQPAPVRQGVVVGRVLDASTQRPLSGAQVSLPGTGQGAVADGDGRFQLQSVPAGEVSLRVQMIGYATQERTVNVPSGGSVTADFNMTRQALSLEEVIVTGTAGGSQRRAIGNVVASLDADAVMDRSPIVNVEQLLVGRTTSVRAQSTPGQVGTGSPVIIRGIGTLTQGNDPIVYIDGVRMYSSPRDGVGQRGGANQSRLNDIHPSDIASMEIIKGPAAATLYGTEASNGVIQIITKRGQEGRPQFDISTRTGVNWMWNPSGRSSDGRCFIAPADANLPPGIPLPENESYLPGTYCMNVYDNEIRETGTPLYGYGALQSYNLAVRGGTDMVRYSSSVSRTHDVGVVDWNWDKRTTLRLNLESVLSDQVTVTAGGAYISGQTRLSESTLQTSTFHGIVRSDAAHLLDGRRGWAQVPPEDMRQVEARNDVDRTTLSLELRYQPLSWFNHRLVTGVDRNTYDNWILHPRYPQGSDHFFGQLALGQKSFTKGNRNFLTVDYSTSADFSWRDYTFQPAAGFQYYKMNHSSITATASEFPAVPITTVSGGAVRQAGEFFTENATVGVYVQQTVGWNNRAFVTAAVRADDNSAFGANFDAAIYPKISGTWVISEESFFDFPVFDQLRMRAAWGAAGKQPDAFAASRLYSPYIGYLNQPSLISGAFGNADLKPERGDEVEFGFDTSVMDGRLELEFTRYSKRVTDAILNRPLPPSTGFTGSQLVNIGRINAWGNEIGALIRVVQGPRFSWEVDTQWSTMGNEIIDMGGLDTRFNREGYPIQSHFGRYIIDGEINENQQVLWATCDGGAGADGLRMGGPEIPCADAPQVFQGNSQPTWQLGIGNTVTLYQNLRLSARIDGNGGHWNTHNYGAPVGHRDNFQVNPDPMRWLLLAYGGTTARPQDPLYDASFLRLSELSATLDLPDHLSARIGARRSSMSLGMRNVAMLWTGQHGWSTPRDGSIRHAYRPVIVWDPDISSTATNPAAGGPQTAMPPSASAMLTLRVSF